MRSAADRAKFKDLMEKYRILLINAVHTDSEVETRYPNLGLAYLVSSVRKNIKDVEFEFRIIDSDIKKITDSFKPHIAGITSVSQNYHIALSYAQYLTDINIPVILGGIHVSFLPNTVPEYVAAACIGEGEASFSELINAFIKNDFDHATKNRIQGIVYWHEGRLITTSPRPVEANLDKIPLPARELLKINPHAYMFTSRGCP
ncbi:MAG: cobalamin-dependent protein, partial [bacterium]